MPVNRTDKIYARVTVHHEAVRQLKEIPNHDAFISVCDDQFLMIWKFDHVGPKKLQVLVKTNLCRQLLNIAVCGSFIMLGFEQSDNHIVAYSQSQGNFVWVKT